LSFGIGVNVIRDSCKNMRCIDGRHNDALNNQPIVDTVRTKRDECSECVVRLEREIMKDRRLQLCIQHFVVSIGRNVYSVQYLS
jgi:uncharacterized protein YcfJ